jgi:peptidylprolyl isomerase
MTRTWTTLVATLLLTACASAPPRPREIIPAANGETHFANGIRYIDIATGTGALMAHSKCVFTHYTGWLADGTRFDSSHDASADGAPGEPVAFIQGTARVLPGWEVGFDGMRVGGRRRLFIPYQLAYGEKGNPPLIPARSALIFDVELMALVEPASNRCPTWSSISNSR